MKTLRQEEKKKENVFRCDAECILKKKKREGGKEIWWGSAAYRVAEEKKGEVICRGDVLHFLFERKRPMTISWRAVIKEKGSIPAREKKPRRP